MTEVTANRAVGVGVVHRKLDPERMVTLCTDYRGDWAAVVRCSAPAVARLVAVSAGTGERPCTADVPIPAHTPTLIPGPGLVPEPRVRLEVAPVDNAAATVSWVVSWRPMEVPRCGS